jgi:hypothetical protein
MPRLGPGWFNAARGPAKATRAMEIPGGVQFRDVKARDGKLLEMPRWAAVGVGGSMVPWLGGS